MEAVQKVKAKSKKGSSKLFWTAAGFTAIFSVWSLVNPAGLTTTLWTWVYKFHDHFNWFTISMPLVLLALAMYLAFSKYGDVKLG